MIKATRLNGKTIYLNYLQIQYMESIPETKICMINGDYYLVKETVESIMEQVLEFINHCIVFQDKRK